MRPLGPNQLIRAQGPVSDSLRRRRSGRTELSRTRALAPASNTLLFTNNRMNMRLTKEIPFLSHYYCKLDQRASLVKLYVFMIPD
jgi:hypothetical protein